KLIEQELIRAKDKAEESDRLKSAFLANMSHEIRTPMNGILGFAELLKEPHLTGEEQQQYINIIDRSGKRMLNVINDIVSISRIEAGQMAVSISATQIADQIQYVKNFFNPEAERKGLHLRVVNKLPVKESLIKTDREKLYAILTNLVGNAIKFTNAGVIELGVDRKIDYLEFYVKDTGIGISEDQKEIIFERFRQGGDLTNRFNEGTGLGLSITKAFVELLGGKIWLDSELGEGSIFYFTLPYTAASETQSTIKKNPANPSKDKVDNDLKILIVEDDEDSKNLITKVIKKFGKEIIYAKTGVEAVETCRVSPDINLILMDVRMPDMDGYEATRQIRQFNKEVIIIAQTAFAMLGDREKAITAGCNDYIAKPIKIEAFKSLIEAYFIK
ncbi:MAG: ATP-binding protein, partial [Bacteroidetes bacterium]|nr:ATP-binding protein [Bacteroidota bacterium]